jgi:flagellar basal-body rod protein FlgC
MNLLGVLEISASALTAERQRAEVVASNMANAETTHTPAGGPYRRQLVIFGPQRPAVSAFAKTLARYEPYAEGVRVERTVVDPTPPICRFEPSHPDADARGYVSYPSINPIEEMVEMMEAARSFAVNAAAVQSTKQMITESLDILR